MRTLTKHIKNIVKNIDKIEFGSDFHLCEYPTGDSLLNIYETCNLYIDGRQALIDLIVVNKWENLWLPTYYCYDFISSLTPYINIKYYECTPFDDIHNEVAAIDSGDKDAVVVVNYFGLKSAIGAFAGKMIIEDHSHDLVSDWALKSQADWCFASLRKTLPIADGGILWSPKGLKLPPQPKLRNASENLANNRYHAMRMKRDYLVNGLYGDKETYRKIYIETERGFDTLPISNISSTSFDIVSSIDIRLWYEQKKNNWLLLSQNLNFNEAVKIFKADGENAEKTPFSLMLICADVVTRDLLRAELIKNNIYPAILWDVPNVFHNEARMLSKTLLSVHCDGRYSSDEIEVLIRKINGILRCLK